MMFVEAISTDPPQRIDPSRPFPWRPLHGSMLSLRRRERTDGRSSRRWRPKSKRRRSVGYRGVRPGCDDPGRGYQRDRHPDHLARNHRRERSFHPDPHTWRDKHCAAPTPMPLTERDRSPIQSSRWQCFAHMPSSPWWGCARRGTDASRKRLSVSSLALLCPAKVGGVFFLKANV